MFKINFDIFIIKYLIKYKFLIYCRFCIKFFVVVILFIDVFKYLLIIYVMLAMFFFIEYLLVDKIYLYYFFRGTYSFVGG